MPNLNSVTDKIAASFLARMMDSSKKSDDSPWASIKNKLLSKYGTKTYNSWLKPLSLVKYNSGHVTLSAPTDFLREWVMIYYLDVILSLWKQHDPSVCAIDVRVKAEENNSQPKYTVVEENDKFKELGSPIDPLYKFENFVVAKSNELAFAAAKKISESNSVVSESNPLFLYGGVGLGKTHLMHALAWNIKKFSKRKVIYLSAEKFMYQYINALRNKSIMAFKEKFRSVDVLLIDDVQFISGKDNTQEEFFHTFNSLMDQKKQLVISADRSPSDLNGVEDRIKSRLGWGLVADIHGTTFELRMGVLESKISRMSINVPQQVITLLAQKITSNIRELEGALNKVVAHASLVNQEVTLESTQEILSDLIRANQSSASIADIQKTVSEFFKIKTSDMLSNRRLKSLVIPRQVSMYLCKEITNKSLPDIGKSFGGKGHATVIYAANRIKQLIETDKELNSDILKIKSMLAKRAS